jgi:thymidylate synthase ThyX
MGVTKQLCNRLLEPFLYHTIIATATEWENFIALRAHNQAEIHIQDAAFKILEALNNSKPKLLQPGEWHIPFGDNINEDKLADIYYSQQLESPIEAAIKIAIARCARVSYMNFEGKDDYVADIKLFDMLKESGHMSPFEHVAQALDSSQQSGNFVGFQQFRKVCEGENKNDNRLLNYKNL